MEKKIKVCFINSVCGFGSTGRIVEDLAKIEGIDSLIIYGRKSSDNPKAYKMTSLFGNCVAAMNTILFNKNGLSNKRETNRAIKKIKEFDPDIIHLHNLHGYYINYEILFNFLKNYNKPVIWTLHDCWAFTGYCPHFDYVNCDKYKIECNKECPHAYAYPFSLFKQNIKKQYYLKSKLFNEIKDLTLVTPSKWLNDRLKESFIKDGKIKIINNGIDAKIFKSSINKNKEFTVLFVSNVWTNQKGCKEIIKIVSRLDKSIKVIVVGKIKKNKTLKNRCILIERTKNLNELRNLYSQSHLFINPTLEDNYPTVNIEALMCGTPVITYDTGGSIEIPNDKCGIIVEKGNYEELAKIINSLKINYSFTLNDCLDRAKVFSKDNMLKKYIELYKEVLDV